MTVRLYVLKGTFNSLAAEANLSRAILQLGARIDFETVDVLKKPDLALSDGVLVTPTLIVTTAGGTNRMIGKLEPVELVVQLLAHLPTEAGDDKATRSAADNSERR